MEVLAFRIFAHLEDYGVHSSAYPTDGAVLLGQSDPMIQIVRVRKYFLYFFKSDASLRVGPELATFLWVKPASHQWYNGYTT
jgi:hypothetical protein